MKAETKSNMLGPIYHYKIISSDFICQFIYKASHGQLEVKLSNQIQKKFFEDTFNEDSDVVKAQKSLQIESLFIYVLSNQLHQAFQNGSLTTTDLIYQLDKTAKFGSEITTNGNYSLCISGDGLVQVNKKVKRLTGKIQVQAIKLKLQPKELRPMDHLQMRFQNLENRLVKILTQKSLSSNVNKGEIAYEKTNLKIIKQNCQTYYIKQGNNLSYFGVDGKWSHAFIDINIPKDCFFSFQVKIIKTQNKYIMLGICDKKKQLHSRYSYDSGNAMAYYGHNGYQYPGLGNAGSGFKVDDIVEIFTNFHEKIIGVKVNGVKQSAYTHAMMGQINRQFVPYVEMYNTFDEIQWLGSRIIPLSD